MTNPCVAIVILNYNGCNFLQQFLPSVLQTTYANAFIVVADNASTDNSVAWMQENHPTIKLLLNQQNNGYAGGYNWALSQIEADYFVLLNSDIEVEPNWLNPLVNLMEVDKTIGAVQPKILAYHNKTHFEYAGASGGFLDIAGYPFSRGRIFDFCEQDTQQYQNPMSIFWATGAALMVRADAFKKVGGLDDFFFAHMEEIDLCWRMQLAGYKIYVQPASIVYHVGGGTLPKGYRKTYLNFRNNLIMLCKNLPFLQKLYLIPFRYFLDGIAGLQALSKGDFTTYKAIFWAHIHVIQWGFGQKKLNQFKKLPIQQLVGVYKGLIVWQYFVKKKKTFTELLGK